MHIVIDIETVPVQVPAHVEAIRDEMAGKLSANLAQVRAPANYKDPAKIAEYVETERNRLRDLHDADVEKAILSTSFDGGYGQIVCVGWCIGDDEPQSMRVQDLSLEQERAMLRDWCALMQSLHGTSGTRPVLIGHNLLAFDLPFVWKRAMVHGIKPPFWLPRDPKPWSETVVDTMTYWAGTRDRISLDKLCRVLGVPGKGDGPTGADVWPMVQDGRLDDVAQYCRDDVVRTRAVFKRMTFA